MKGEHTSLLTFSDLLREIILDFSAFFHCTENEIANPMYCFTIILA